MSYTHTYAILEVSQQTYNEIREKLELAGYQDQFHDDVIDLHGIALQVKQTQWIIYYPSEQKPWRLTKHGSKQEEPTEPTESTESKETTQLP